MTETAKPEAARGGIDCHAHVFLASLPTVAGARYRPTGDARLEAYLALLDANALSGGVLVQLSFLGSDNAYLLAEIARAGGRLRGIAGVEPGIAPSDLIALRQHGIMGVRLNLLGRPLPDFAAPEWQTHFARLAAAGLHLEVHADPAVWPALLPALTTAGVPLVIDHLGRPASLVETGDGYGAALAAVRLEHVWVKLSGPYRFAAPAREAALRLLDAAGSDERFVWGSDWPWTQHPEITDYAGLKAALFDWLPAASASRVLVENPRRLYWRA